MDVPKLKNILLKYVANEPTTRMLHEWQKTADILGIQKNELEYLVNEMGESYFDECKDGFFAKNKAIIEGKHDIEKDTGSISINYIGVNNGNANQGRDFDIRDQNFSNNPPNQNINTKSQKSFWQKILQFIVDNIVQIIVGVIVSLLALFSLCAI